MPEGSWGLDPNLFEGAGGAPTTFGTWTARWWDCSNCANEPGANGSYRQGASIFLQKATRPAPNFTNTVIGINYPMGNGKPAGAPASFPVDRFVGEFVLDTPVVGSTGFPVGNRTLLVVSDDGVRVRMQEIDAGGNPVGATPAWASCIDNWKDQSPTTSTCTLNFTVNKRYRITMHYYEGTSGATLAANIAEGRYSISDSPTVGGSTAPDQFPLAYANTSLRMDVTIDMTDLPANFVPILIYRTKYRMGTNTYGRVEVSTDGGFTWTQAGLNTAVAGFTFSSPNINNALRNPSDTTVTWEQRIQNLSAYKDSQLLVRFRFDRQLENCARTIRNGTSDLALKCVPAGSASGDEFIKGFFDGWWISRVQIPAP
jgi:hypothetical protein